VTELQFFGARLREASAAAMFKLLRLACNTAALHFQSVPLFIAPGRFNG
jgi:hypothetical protein